ncbi:MAG: hypothetical protein PHI90_03355 [Clostridia bacterium]|nr:hypothetical protein [Clostridia bacterium]MDD4047853.1 hypothetical protein [Clostridia bacterium]
MYDEHKECLQKELLQVVEVEIADNIALDTIIELRHPILKIYDLKASAYINYKCSDGMATIEGLIDESIYYVGFLDWMVYYQPYQQKFSRMYNDPKIKKDMKIISQIELKPEQILSSIHKDYELKQTILVKIMLHICSREFISSG